MGGLMLLLLAGCKATRHEVRRQPEPEQLVAYRTKVQGYIRDADLRITFEGNNRVFLTGALDQNGDLIKKGEVIQASALDETLPKLSETLTKKDLAVVIFGPWTHIDYSSTDTKQHCEKLVARIREAGFLRVVILGERATDLLILSE
jgi:hypothetical protein